MVAQAKGQLQLPWQQNGAIQKPETSQLEVNHFPNCVFMRLHCTPIQPEQASSPFLRFLKSTFKLPIITVKQTELKLTIRFGAQAIKVPGGQIRFGLKRGELKLEIEKSRIPLEKMALIAEFATVIESEVQQERGKEAEANLAVAASFKTKEVGKTADKLKYNTYQVFTEGTETKPVWVFEAKTKSPILSGQRTEEKMGTVEITSQPCHVKATFEVRGQQACI